MEMEFLNAIRKALFVQHVQEPKINETVKQLQNSESPVSNKSQVAFNVKVNGAISWDKPGLIIFF